MESIHAEDIFTKIKNGENVRLTDRIILGDFDIDSLGLARDEDGYICIDSSISIINSVIEGSANLNNTIFLKSVVFSGTIIKGNISFEFSRFEKLADFSSVIFDSNATFWHVQFIGKADFSPTHIKGPTYLKGTQFNKNANFEFAKFFDLAEFSEVTFHNDSVFFGAEFDKEADFCETKFEKCADFYSAKFKADLIFWDAEFEFIQMEWGTELSKFHANWNDIRRSLVCDYGPTYLSMIKSFKELEQFDDADNCYYDYRKWSQRNKPFGWSKFSDYLAWISCGYGVRPSYTVFFSIFLIFLFAVLFQIAAIFYSPSSPSTIYKNTSVISLKSALISIQGIDYQSFFTSLILSLKIFVTGELFDVSGIARYVAMLELPVRGLLFALFMVVLVKKLIR